jgi:hypothetical protein
LKPPYPPVWAGSVGHAALVKHGDAAVGRRHHLPGRAGGELAAAARGQRRERGQRECASTSFRRRRRSAPRRCGSGSRTADPADDDVAQVAIQLQRPHRRAAAGRQADQLAVRARDVDQIGAGVVGQAARRRADRWLVTVGCAWRGSKVTTAPAWRSATWTVPAASSITRPGSSPCFNVTVAVTAFAVRSTT